MKRGGRPRVLELNNIDIYGKNFNGYSLTKYINTHRNTGLDSVMLVNHKLGISRYVKKLFSDTVLESCDYRIGTAERIFGAKNQFSIAGEALLENKEFRRADVLHFHMYHNMQLPIEFLTKIDPEKKIILDLHDTFWLTDSNIPMLEAFSYSNINKTSLDAQRRRVLHGIDAEFVVHSQYMLNLFKRSGATHDLPVTLINFGINLDKFKPLNNVDNLRRKYKIPEGDFVCMCREQKEFKGLDYIIRALNGLETARRITLITVSGKGLLGDLARSINVLEFGAVGSDDKMAELYNMCDVFLAPSTEESFGFMAVEAMACGKPVIVFEGTALPDTVSAPTIGISTRRSSEELRKAIERMMAHKEERERRGLAGLKYVRERFNEEDYFRENIELYKRLAAKSERNIKGESQPNREGSKTDESLDSVFDTLESYILKGDDQESLSANLIVDYNDFNVQEELRLFNAKVYAAAKQNETLTLKQKFFRLIPVSIRNLVKKAIKYEQRKV